MVGTIGMRSAECGMRSELNAGISSSRQAQCGIGLYIFFLIPTGDGDRIKYAIPAGQPGLSCFFPKAADFFFAVACLVEYVAIDFKIMFLG